MPSVSFDGQSLSVRGRRVWLTSAEFHYAAISADRWGDRLRVIRQAGFNAVTIACPWNVHESRPGHIDMRGEMQGELDLRSLIETCAALGLWVTLKIGPVVGAPYDGGGLPGWLSDLPGVRVRQPNQIFFERVTAWYRALAQACAGLLATDAPGGAVGVNGASQRRAGVEAGPVVAVQIEDNWRSADESLSDAYLGELVRFAREVGFNVPLLTANASFATHDAAIDLLDVGGDALALMRQLGAVRPGFPRFAIVQGSATDGATAAGLALAGGAQFIVRDALGVASRHARVDGGLFDHQGNRVDGGRALRRVVQFASSFGHVLAQADRTHQVAVVDPSDASNEIPSVIPLAGAAGRVIIVARRQVKKREQIALLLPDGRAFRASLGTSPLSWFLLDADLAGRSHLDYATVAPIALVDRSMLVCAGVAGEEAEVSIDGSVLRLRVPAASAGSKPTVERLRDLTIVLCNDAQIDAMVTLDHSIVIGASDVATDGGVLLAEGFKTAHQIDSQSMRPIAKELLRAKAPVQSTADLRCVSVGASDMVDGSSHRYATLTGPASLAACGARDGVGWYRVSFSRAAAGKVCLHFPSFADSATLWLDGSYVGTFDRAAGTLPVELKLTAGQHQLVALIESFGRPMCGDHLARRSGLFGGPVAVAAVKSKPVVERERRVDPFALGFLYEMHPGDVRPGIAVTWRLPASTTTRYLLDMSAAGRAKGVSGTVTLGGTPVARWTADGPEGAAVLLTLGERAPERSGGKSTKPKSAPAADAPVDISFFVDHDPGDSELAAFTRSLTLYEVLGGIGEKERYAFARWAPPPVWPNATEKIAKNVPVWHRATMRVDQRRDALLMVPGATPTRVLINGRLAATLRSGEPSERSLVVQRSFLADGENEIALFSSSGEAIRGPLQWTPIG